VKLWVLRHGEAEPRANTDAERRLTAHGREQVLHSAAHLLGQPLQAIIASPYVRAQQTAALVHDTLGFAEPVRTVPWLTPEMCSRSSAKSSAWGLSMCCWSATSRWWAPWSAAGAWPCSSRQP
jgi:phosphohistidine phosphatase SixA